MSTRSDRFKAWAVLLMLAVLSGCTSAPQTVQLLKGSPQPLTRSALIADVPFYPQEAYQCGPAALAMVLTQGGVDTRPEALVAQVYLPARQGSLQPEILAAVRRAGRLPYLHPPRIDALLTALDNREPVLVLLNLGLESLPHWHYAVLIGYDLAQGTVTLHSGLDPEVTRPLSLFEQAWRRGGYWAVSALNPDALPVHKEQRRYLQATLGLLQADRTDDAERALLSARRAWPQSPLPWMLEGNQLLGSRAPHQAEQAFRQALARDAALTPAWNNLAYALDAQGCREAARQALTCGLKIAPDAAALKESLTELAAPAEDSVAHCPPVTCDPGKKNGDP